MQQLRKAKTLLFNDSQDVQNLFFFDIGDILTCTNLLVYPFAISGMLGAVDDISDKNIFYYNGLHAAW